MIETHAASKFLRVLTLGIMIAPAIANSEITEIPEKYMYSKGGVLYPHTGDSSQKLFQTPETARQMFPPGTLIGVLPADCMSVSKGGVDYFRCDYDFAMKEEALPDGRMVYRVIEAP